MQKRVMMGVIAAVVLAAIIIGFNFFSNQAAQSSAPPQTEIPSEESKTESAASANTPAQEGLIEAKIENFAFAPSEIRIKVGSKITWINNDNAIHTVTSDSGGKTELNSKFLNKGDSYGHV